jgi:curved DNA-binding protein CbpA
MNVITIEGKQYDPYFILDVTKEDSLEHIKKTFRAKVKKYHPDKYTDLLKKAKYEKYFKILSESYQYIKNKRQDTLPMTNPLPSKGDQIKKNIDLDNFNKTFEKSKDPNHFGYGDDYNRIERIEDYENIDVKYCNQFENSKFTTKEFNKIFEYNKNSEDDDKDKVITKSMIHKTTDGFFGYNTSDITNCALVSSFNGLLITGDNLGERGVGYWGNNYSDYKFSYKTSKNPNSKIIIKKDDTNKDNTIEKKITSEEISKYKNEYDQHKYKRGYGQNTSGNFSQQGNLLYKKTYEDLVKKEFEDKDMVIKYITQYSTKIIDQALSGELPESRKYSSALRKYIKE